MRKMLLSVFTLLAISAHAQVYSLHEDFNTICASSGMNYPYGWTELNYIAPEDVLAWNCTPTGGRWGTPGTQCNGFYSGSYHLDSAWLLTPLLNLGEFTSDSIYLQFDTRYEYAASKLSVLHYSPTDTLTPPVADFIEFSSDSITGSLSPTVGDPDSSNWVTHQINVTAFREIPFYMAFRYTSADGSGGIWTIDNVRLSDTAVLGVAHTTKTTIPLTAIGNGSSSVISIAYTVVDAGKYDLSVFDMVGKKIYSRQIECSAGLGTCRLCGLNLASGMYLVKLSNGGTSGITKVVVP